MAQVYNLIFKKQACPNEQFHEIESLRKLQTENPKKQ